MNVLWDYFSPANPAASFVVDIIAGLGVVWLLGIIASAIWLKVVVEKQIDALADVQGLVTAQRADSGTDDSVGDGVRTDPDEVFDQFCRDRQVSKGVISGHLRAIFSAGYSDSRIEVGDLLRYSTGQLYPWNDLFRSVLATFIVIGLLGTLFGLADSLGNLSLATGSSFSTQAGELKGLEGLLGALKSAFAPSIWGISLTIVGIVAFGLYLRLVCAGVKRKLEWATLTVWVPQLCKPASQKLMEMFQESGEQVRNNFDAARKVAVLAESVQSNVGDFARNLDQANQVTLGLTGAVGEINQASERIHRGFAEGLVRFSNEFAVSVGQLTSFQEDLRVLYQQLLSDSTVFRTEVQETLKPQAARMQKILAALKSYEEAYIAERKQIDEKMQRFLDEATEASTSLNAQNRQLMQDIHSSLTRNLSQIGETLRVQLTGIFQVANESGLRSADILRETTGRLSGSQENFDTRMTGIVRDLQVQIQHQNENSTGQLESLRSLNQQIVELLAHLAQNSQLQAERVQLLSSNIDHLTQDVSGLSLRITDLGGAIGPLAQLGPLMGQVVGNLEKISSKDEALSGNIGRLAKEIEAFGARFPDPRLGGRRGGAPDANALDAPPQVQKTKRRWWARLWGAMRRK